MLKLFQLSVKDSSLEARLALADSYRLGLKHALYIGPSGKLFIAKH